MAQHDCKYCREDDKDLSSLMTHVTNLPASKVYLWKDQTYYGRCVVAFNSHKTELFALTPGELDPLGGMNAPIGASNSVPMDERQRCLLLIKRVLYDVWDQPTVADAGHQAALLEVRFDLSGRVVGAVIAQSSGSEIMDRSVLLAARNVTRVEGLTVGFLREYPKLIVEFKVAE